MAFVGPYGGGGKGAGGGRGTGDNTGSRVVAVDGRKSGRAVLICWQKSCEQ